MTTQPKSEIMTAAYLEAAVFTDLGDTDQPPSDAEFSPLARAQAWAVCHNFLMACDDLLKDVSMEQAGHDLWLTRNGHGSGFWDRPEVYGTARADTFSRCAQVLGSTSLYQGDDGLLYFE